jgi:pimeloyl-ACP methyl ester carboxylesterase
VIHVLALHGNGGGGERFARAAASCPSDVRLHAPTLPGFGGVPADPRLVDLAGFAEVARGHLRALPRPRVLLGHGIGGSIALQLGQREARDADALILHAPVGPLLDRRRFPRLMRLPGMRGLVRGLLVNRALRPWWTRKLFDGASPEGPMPQADRDAFFAGYAHCAAFAAMFDLITPAWFAALRPIDLPGVLWWGERDGVLRSGHAELLRPLLPRARVLIEPGWAHFPMLDRPRAYAARLAELARELVLP